MALLESGEENAIEIPMKFEAVKDVEDAECVWVMSYTDNRGTRRVHRQTIDLPILNFYRLIPPIKAASKQASVNTPTVFR